VRRNVSASSNLLDPDGPASAAHIIRPAVMFGPDDAFLTTILAPTG